MRKDAQERFYYLHNPTRMNLRLMVAIVLVMMIWSDAIACHVLYVNSLTASKLESGPYSSNPTMCNCDGSIWVKVQWTSAGGSPQDAHWLDNWKVEIWDPGSGSTYPPTGTIIKSVILPWNIDSENPQTGVSKTAAIKITGLSPGGYTFRAWVKRTTSTSANGHVWEQSPVCLPDLIDVEITVTKDYVVLVEYGSDIDRDFGSDVDPGGGSYEWEKYKFASGDIILENETSSTVTVKPNVASSYYDDVGLFLTYTWAGKSCIVSTPVTVYKPNSTNSIAGRLDEQMMRITRNYYHEIKNQFGHDISETGIPCTEDLTWMEGPEQPVEEDGSTQDYPADGAWNGGIALQDVLGCSSNSANIQFDQTISAGDYSTTPKYYLFYQPLEYESEKIWKQSH